MGTTSTIPAVKTKLVELFDDAADVPAFYAWPGPSCPPRAVFLGRHPELDDVRIDGTSEDPTIKAGRRQRQETYRVPVTVWSFRPDLTAQGAEEAETDAFALAGPVEGVLADQVDVGLGPQVHRAYVSDVASTLFPFERGWACELVLTVEVTARLT